jgi:uncharacterized SAM-binding protein YcdF (DUF218 family)
MRRHMTEDRQSAEVSGPLPDQPRGGRRVLLRSGLIAVCAILVILGGFAEFWRQSASLKGPDKADAEGIVVLTGGPERISTAIRLLENKAAKRLLISGVHPQTTARQLRQITGTERDLFRCCIDLDKRAADTRGNAVEAAEWARDKGFTRLLIVTSDYHILRAMKEFSRVMPEAELMACPVAGSDGHDPLHSTASLKLWFSEYLKYLLALVRIQIGN